MKTLVYLIWGLIALVNKNIFEPLRKSLGKLGKRTRRKSKKTDDTKVSKSRYYERVKKWAITHESKKMREFRVLFTAKENEKKRMEPYSIINIYDTVRLYILTDKWDPFLKLSPPILGIFPFALAMTAPFFLLQIDSTSNAIVCLLMLIISFFIFGTTLKLIDGIAGKLLLWLLVIASAWYWVIMMLPLLTEEIELLNFILLACFFLGGLLSTVSFMAYMLQWRLIDPFTAIQNWIVYALSSHNRESKVSQVAAWLVFLAPSEENLYGIANSPDIDLLSEVNRTEKEGIDRRAIILSILAFIGITQLSDLSHFLELDTNTLKSLTNMFPSSTVIPVIYSIYSINLNVFIILTLGLVVWGIFLEVWLSEFPNRILGLSCLYAKQYIFSSEQTKHAYFRKFRTVNTKSPETIESKKEIPSWLLIAKQQLNTGEWKCLLQVNHWIDNYEVDVDEQ